MAKVGYNINYPEEVIVKIISKIVQKLEGHQEYIRKINNDPTSNHIYYKRGDEINKGIVEFVNENPDLPFRYKVVSSGRSAYKHVKLFDYEKKILSFLKKLALSRVYQKECLIEAMKMRYLSICLSTLLSIKNMKNKWS